MNSLDLNIEHYTVPQLLTILGVDSLDNVDDYIQEYITAYESDDNEEMAQFFRDMQSVLNDYGDVNLTEEANTTQWFQQANALQQNDSVQRDKNSDRRDKIQVYNNGHVPMNRQHIGIANTLSVPVAQDTLNPNLKNITTRYINVDSQFRPATNSQDSSPTDFMMELSEPLNNVLSLKMYSTQIPFSWYAVDNTLGNTYFWVVFTSTASSLIYIEGGNYSPTDFVDALNNHFVVANGWTCPLQPVSYSKYTGKIKIQFAAGTLWTDTSTSITYNVVDGETQLVFFDVTGTLPTNGPSQKTINQTLGWLMGYRMPFVIVNQGSGNTADTLIDLYGPRYLILAIDDFNQNHINSGLITITETSKNIKLPSYYNPTFPVKYTNPLANNLASNTAESVQGNNGDLLMEKLNLANKAIPQVLPTAPRILTQAQIYSINEIMKNNEQNTQYKSRAPSSSDTFALVPVKHADNLGSVMIELTSSLMENKRIYFGPVNIDRLRIRWYDDKGNILNTNGADWSVTLIAEILYQY